MAMILVDDKVVYRLKKVKSLWKRREPHLKATYSNIIDKALDGIKGA